MLHERERRTLRQYLGVRNALRVELQLTLLSAEEDEKYDTLKDEEVTLLILELNANPGGTSSRRLELFCERLNAYVLRHYEGLWRSFFVEAGEPASVVA